MRDDVCTEWTPKSDPLRLSCITQGPASRNAVVLDRPRPKPRRCLRFGKHCAGSNTCPSFSSLDRESRPSLSVSCASLSFSVILGASPGIQALPSLLSVRRETHREHQPGFPPSVRMTDGEAGEHVAHFLPSVILGASPGIQALPSLLSVRREAHREHQPGFPPSVRMTDGEAGEHVAHFLPSVILGASPGIQALPSLLSVRRETHREHQPGFPPSVRMTDGEAGEHVAHFLPSVILGASPGIQALPSLLSVRRETHREHQPGFPPSVRMTDGEAGEHVAHFLPSVILGASPGIQALPSLLSVRRETHREHQPGFPPSVRMTDGKAGEHVAHFLPSVILGASPGIQALPSLLSVRRETSPQLTPQPTPS